MAALLGGARVRVVRSRERGCKRLLDQRSDSIDTRLCRPIPGADLGDITMDHVRINLLYLST